MSGSRSLSDNEIKDIKELLSIRDLTLIEVGLKTGFRISELLSLRVSDVTQHGSIAKQVTVTRSRMKGKRQSRTVVLHCSAQQAITKLIEYYKLTSDSYLFQSRQGDNKPISRAQAHNVLSNVADMLKLDGRISSHSLRKSFASRVYKASGNNLLVTKEALGHANISSTSHYLSTDQDEVDDIILNMA